MAPPRRRRNGALGAAGSPRWQQLQRHGGHFPPGTGASPLRRNDGEDSDNSIKSEPCEEEMPPITAAVAGGEEGAAEVKFFDVKAGGGEDAAPTLEDANEAMRQALPLAEQLDEVAPSPL